MSSSTMTLETTTAYTGLPRTVGEVTLREVGNRSIVCMAFAVAARDAVDTLCESALGANLPAVGKVSRAQDGLTLLGLQHDQIWCTRDGADRVDEKCLLVKLGYPDGIYLTNQGDGWSTLVLDGGNVTAVLERLCLLDLDLRSFPVGMVARTVMDHMSTVIVRTGESTFDIMTPRSFASSLLHAIENVALHIHNESRL
ncbi:MAG: hypothetical protein HKN42_16485 [Granulosicoccus sp.]|nr:hypothetical protein [Granulosicoccus sp.]